MVNFFSTKYMAHDDFSDPLNALIPKIPFSFFAEFWVRGTGDSLGKILGGGSIEPFGGGSSQRAVSTPTPPQLKARPPLQGDREDGEKHQG